MRIESCHEHGQPMAPLAASWLSSRLFRDIAVLVVSMLSLATTAVAGDGSIASRRSHGLYVSLARDGGGFAAGSNEYCLSFTTAPARKPVDVKSIRVEFAQQVGRILERPIISPVVQLGAGRYCGSVDLGKQYYVPAFYRVTVHYSYATGKRKRCRFLLTVK